MARIIAFEPRSGRATMRSAPLYNFRLSLTKRLELLRENKTRPTLPSSQQYRARAEECRFEAETFRDPKARAQMLQLAANYEQKAMQAEKFERARDYLNQVF